MLIINEPVGMGSVAAKTPACIVRNTNNIVISFPEGRAIFIGTGFCLFNRMFEIECKKNYYFLYFKTFC